MRACVCLRLVIEFGLKLLDNCHKFVFIIWESLWRKQCMYFLLNHVLFIYVIEFGSVR